MKRGPQIEPPRAPISSQSRGVRILAVGNMYPPQHAGGYETAWQQTMRHAAASGNQVRILTTDYRGDPTKAEEDPDVHRTLRWYWDLERYEFPRLTLLQRLAVERHNANELRRHIEEFRPDVIAWWSMGCMSLSLIEQVKRAEVPAIFIVHDDWLGYGWEHDQWMRTWQGPRRGRVAPVAARLCGVATDVEVNDAGRFVFNSQYTLERAREARLTTSAVEVVYPGVDERFLEPLPAGAWRWRLVYVGRIDRQKGVDTAVSALAHLPEEATLTVWGTGDQRYVTEMLNLADRIGAAGRVSFKGFAEPEELRAGYEAADAVVFPVRWNEPFGLVPLEAMGVGRPVVTTARGGTSEFVRDGENALVFEADSGTALAGCVGRLATDQDLRERLVAGGRRTAAEYTVSRFVEGTLAEILRVAQPVAPDS